MTPTPNHQPISSTGVCVIYSGTNGIRSSRPKPGCRWAGLRTVVGDVTQTEDPGRWRGFTWYEADMLGRAGHVEDLRERTARMWWDSCSLESFKVFFWRLWRCWQFVLPHLGDLEIPKGPRDVESSYSPSTAPFHLGSARCSDSTDRCAASRDGETSRFKNVRKPGDATWRSPNVMHIIRNISNAFRWYLTAVRLLVEERTGYSLMRKQPYAKTRRSLQTTQIFTEKRHIILHSSTI